MPDQSQNLRRAFVALAALLLPLMLVASRDFGATWDEPQQRAKALQLLAYWAGESKRLVVPLDGAHLYGAPLDVIAAALERRVPADPYVLRHLTIAVCGWLGLLLCGLLADRLFGPPHGFAALTFLATCPWYIGHAMNNPKDIPFATVATGLLMALTHVGSRAPFLSWRLVLMLALVIGISLNVRPGGLLFIGYLSVVVLYRMLMAGPVELKTMARVALRGFVVLAGSIAIGWIAWPWAYAHPVVAPFRAMAELGHFGWGGSVLFEGRDYAGTSLPPAYVPQWFWMVLPPVVMAGVALSLLRFRRPETRPQAIALWGAVLFPVVYVVATRATLYDGVRHLLFVLPPIAILSSAGWIAAWHFSRPFAKRLVVAMLIVGLSEPVLFQWRNYPNQNAYIQPLEGGPRAAFARFDLDYWGNCMLAALAPIDREAKDERVFVTGWPLIVLEADVARFPRLQLVAPDDARATYFVRLARGSREELLRLDSLPDIVTRVTTADGALLCAVAKRRGGSWDRALTY
jgi:hypothetical protein